MGLFANSSFAFEIFISLSLSVGVCSKMPVTPPFTLFRSGTFKIEMTLLTISFLASSSLRQPKTTLKSRTSEITSLFLAMINLKICRIKGYFLS